MDKVNSSGLIKAHIMETFSKITFTVKENTSGQMVVFIMDNGLTTRWKDKVLLLGVMAEDMKETIRMIKNMVMEHSSGQMVESTLENGAKVNSMVKEFISKKAKRDKAFGKWVKELNGSKIPRLTSELPIFICFIIVIKLFYFFKTIAHILKSEFILRRSCSNNLIF